MTTWKQLIPSAYLKQEDVGPGKLVRLKGIEQMDVGAEGSPEFKPCAHFHELDKPLVLNSTNLQLMARITGSDHIEEWMNKWFVLYVDPNVSYQGRLVGGIRVRAPKPGTPLPGTVVPPPNPSQTPVQAATEAAYLAQVPLAGGPPADDSDIPF